MNMTCTEIPGLFRRFFAFGESARCNQNNQTTRRTDFRMAAIFAASGSFVAEDYEPGLLALDIDSVN